MLVTASILTYSFTDDDRLIITCGRTSDGELRAVRCWCPFSGEIVLGHWTESHQATTVSANYVGDKIFFRRHACGYLESFDCVGSQGVLYNSGILNLLGAVVGFVDESTVASVRWVEGASPIVTAIDVMTGDVSSLAADKNQPFAVVHCVVNAALQITYVTNVQPLCGLSTPGRRRGGSLQC
jgi:hypothetical protein